MAYHITEKCTACGACAETCPSQAIVEELGRYIITDKCELCGTCIEICFLEAIEEY